MERIGNLAYNPVSEHIQMTFRRVTNVLQQVEAVVEDLRDQEFDPAQSRVLVFVRTRKQAEEAAVELARLAHEQGLEWADQVDYFHAGLDGTDRSSKYRAYKDEEDEDGTDDATEQTTDPESVRRPVVDADKTLVLVATKAFGMGMDIPNIHYLYHLGPSGTFEDFLQEVGRAGRNAGQRAQAGFGPDRAIRTLCVLTSRDFGELRDLMHKSDLSWQYVADTQQRIHRHLERFGKLQVPTPLDNPFALPLDLDQGTGGEAGADGGVRFRLALHWLEELGRLRLGMYTPTFLPLTLLERPAYDRLSDAAERQFVQQFVEALKTSTYREGDSLGLSVPLEELQRLTGKRRIPEVFRVLFRAQKAQALVVDRQLTISKTKLRGAELRAWHPQSNGIKQHLPLVEAVFALARQLLALVPPGGQRRVEHPEWKELGREVGHEYFTSDLVYWEQLGKGNAPLGKEALCQKLNKDWLNTRAKFALKLIRLLPDMRVKTELPTDGSGRVQLLYNGNRKGSQWQVPLAALHKHLLSLLRHVVEAGTEKFNYADVVVALGLEDEGTEYVDNLLFLARSLGYLQSNGAFMPTGLELWVQDAAVPAPDERTALAGRRKSDYQVYEEFLEGQRLKQLRLLALECLTGLVESRQDAFIKQYFGCQGSAALVGMLGEVLGENHPKLQAYREEALVKAEEQLSDEQRLVYDAPLAVHLQVIAGPGSGKTHTLTLRVARLIHKERVRPGQILVLAYNRAVVVELKDRLGRLFRALGYGRLIKQLHVHTFHSLCRRVLGAALDGVALDEWVPALRTALASNPALLRQELGQEMAYAFVDEFQDINDERLDLLLALAPVEQVKLCVIGDPNQSIYGYERVKANGPMDPHPYYVRLWKIYQHRTLYLSNNYRSYPKILEAASTLLASNPIRFRDIPALRALRQPVPATAYCELLDVANNSGHWHDKLAQLIAEKYDPGPDETGKARLPKYYTQVAVMLRSNDEVFRAFNELGKKQQFAGVTMRVQGASGSPLASREFQELLEDFKKQPGTLLADGYVAAFETKKQAVIKQYGAVWDEYLMELVHCLLREFQAEGMEAATHQDLLDFVTDMARHDDGHFAKLYEKHIKYVAPNRPERREVVLTTMHKVKGLEFDAVLLPPSFFDLGMNWGEPVRNITEVIEEERRLLYVAYTRARYRLAVFRGKREIAVQTGMAWELDAALQQKLGQVVKSGPGKIDVGWGAVENRQFSHEIIRNRVKIGDPIILVKNQWGKWMVEWQGQQISQLGSSNSTKLSVREQIEGLAVSEVKCYTLAESLVFDAAQTPPTTYTNRWGETAKKRGYIYLVDFAGYYKE